MLKTVLRGSTGGVAIGILFCAVLVFTVAADESKAPPSDTAAILDALEHTITQGGIPGLITYLDNHRQMKLPSMHCETYCASLGGQDKVICEKSRAFGEELYKALNDYRKKLEKLSSEEFLAALEKLATLRDRLWAEGSMGSILLADCVQTIIYWSIVERAISCPPQEIGALEKSTGHYADLEKDWEHLAHALAEEYKIPFDYNRIRGGATLSERYQLMIQQLYLQKKFAERQYPVSTIPEMLKSSNLRPFLEKFTQGRRFLRKEQLRYFILLRRRLGTFPRDTGEFIEPPVAIEGAAKVPVILKQFEDLVPQKIPEALELVTPDTKERLYYSDFYVMFERGNELAKPGSRVNFLLLVY